jgi:hypothetical protein
MSRMLVVGLVAVSGICTVIALAILAVSSDLPVPDSWGFRGFATIFAVTFTWTGAALTWRRPRNAIGWLLLSVGVVAATQAALSEYAIVGFIGRPAALPGAVFAAWIVSWVWIIEVTFVAVFLLLLFPDGHFLSRRWRAIGWLGGVGAAAAACGLAFNAGPLNNARYTDNPFALFAVSDTTAFLIPIGGVALASIGAASSLFARYRRSRGVQRQQLKWLASEAIFIVPALIYGSFDQTDKWASLTLIAAIAMAPVMIAIAVLRYRLYDIDVLINRAIVYAATTAAIAAAFFAGIVVLQSALRPLTGGSELAVAASTLVCFALFQPVRRRIQSTVDRRFYRSRYDAARTLDAFTSRLAGEVDLDAVGAELTSAVAATVRPAHMSLWLRKPAP